nr:hypothetical protein [uncultured Draconibacterium sp.]
MIEKIINDLASDEIHLSKALAQSKVLIRKLYNANFKIWVNNELIGYPSDSEDNIPDYRKFSVDVKGQLSDQFGNFSEINIDMDPLSDYVGEDLNIHHEKTSIVAIEELLKVPEDDYVQNPLSREMVRILNASVKQPGLKLTKAYREYHINNLKHIHYNVKQKLLDTLINLIEEFPKIEDEYMNTKENKSKVQNIITYNVYGGNPTSNFGVGDKVIQREITVNRDSEAFINRLKNLKVPNEEITEVSQIINTSPKEYLSQKLMLWFGNLSIKMVEKGLELKLPLIMDSINNFISSIG